MSTRPFLVGAALLALAPSALADGADPKIPVERYTLPNGLEVLLSRDPSVPLVAVDVYYHVGSGDEVVGKSGFAHLFEHMMFQGSKNVPEDKHFDILKKIGAEQINGTTNTDRTNYYEVVPSNQLETALWLESDRMGHLLDVLNKPSLDNQIDVVRNERRLRYDNVPFGKARFAEHEALYPEGHPYRYLTIGRHEDLVAASVDDVKGFFRTWYVPSNATLAVVGDFDVEATKKAIDRWFGSMPKSGKPKAVTIPAPPIKAQTITVEDPFAKQRRIQFAWHAAAGYKDGDAELDILGEALGREGTGRLYKALVYDKQLATQVMAGQEGRQFSGIFHVAVTLRGDADLEQVKKIVAEELAKVTREPITDKEISRAVTAKEAGAIYQLEGNLQRAQTLQEYNQFVGDPDRLSWDLDRYRKATAAKIRDYAAQYLRPDAMVTIITMPKDGAK